MRRLSIRWKLTLWYGGVLAIVLTLFGTTVLLMMRRHLLQRIDQGLHEELSDVLSEITRATDSASLKEWLQRRFAKHEGFDFQVTRPAGERIFANPRLADKSWPLPERTTANQVQGFSIHADTGKGRWRIVDIEASGPDGPLIVQVGRSLAAFDHESADLLMTFLLAGPLTLLAAISGGYFLARRTLLPVHLIAKAASEIKAERLHERIEVVNPDDELGELTATLNGMLERLDRSFVEMQRFTADAAHELRTPLAVIRSEVEVTLRSPRNDTEYRETLETVLEDVHRLSAMADQLLFLSRQDAGLSQPDIANLDLGELLADVVGNMQIVAKEQGVTLELKENDNCQISSDGRLLRRLFVNLIDNGIKYANTGGRVWVTSRSFHDQITVEIRDTGCGICKEELPRVFDRFYRSKSARSDETGGAGLGLSICQSIAKNVGGSIRIDSEASKGTTVKVMLPV